MTSFPDTATAARPFARRLAGESALSSLLYGAVALLVAVPLLRPGYLLLLDFVNGPHVRVTWRAAEDSIGAVNTAPFEAAIWLLERLTGEPSGFLLVFAIVFFMCFGLDRLARTLTPDVGVVGRVVAAVLYAVNPFTYTRLVHGQMGVLVGMAVLPLVLVAFERLRAEPSARRALVLGVAVACLGFVSIHVAGMLLLMFPAMMIARGIPPFRFLAMAAGVALALSSWWLVQTVASPPPAFGGDDLRAFSARPVGWASAGHVAMLYGFWRAGEFPLPFDAIPWFVTVPPLAALVVGGMVASYRKDRRLLAAAGVVVVVGVLVAAGISFPPTAGAFRWIYSSVPGFTMYREPQKWVAVVALVYALMAAVAANRVVAWAAERREGRRLALQPEIVGVVLAGLVLLNATPMIASKSLRPSVYPADWAKANRIMKSDPGRALVLPWHLYMTFPFTGRRVANPAPQFFDVPLVSSDSIEIGPIRTQSSNPDSKLVEDVLRDPDRAARLPALTKQLCTKYVVLLKGADWPSYLWLSEIKELKVLLDGPGVRLFVTDLPVCSSR